MKKIGFAFLLYDRLHNQSILNNLFNDLISKHGCDVRCVAHTKDNVRFNCAFNMEYIDSIDTGWCEPSCVKACDMMFEFLFKQGCDVVYLMSDGMIPLQHTAKFIANNNRTTFRLQTSNFEELNMTQIVHRVCNWAWASNEVRHAIAYNRFDKQVMFFCMTSSDFKKCRVWFDRVRPPHKERQKFSCMDEYFWVNAMNLSGLSYHTSDKYIYVNDDQTKTQSQTFDKIPDGVYENFMFLRKIYLEEPRTFNYPAKDIK